jgi:hypothetical protein
MWFAARRYRKLLQVHAVSLAYEQGTPLANAIGDRLIETKARVCTASAQRFISSVSERPSSPSFMDAVPLGQRCSK